MIPFLITIVSEMLLIFQITLCLNYLYKVGYYRNKFQHFNMFLVSVNHRKTNIYYIFFKFNINNENCNLILQFFPFAICSENSFLLRYTLFAHRYTYIMIYYFLIYYNKIFLFNIPRKRLSIKIISYNFPL